MIARAVTVRAVSWDDPAGRQLRAAQRAEIAERYGTDDSEPGPPPTADDITVFFVAFDDDGAPLGCGGLRLLGGIRAGSDSDAVDGDTEAEAEIKRMFVVPEARGTGVSTAILHTLEAFGRERGWRRLLLETGDAQPDAVRFYTREGYTRIPGFGHYADSPTSLCFEKLLIATDPMDALGCEGCE
jgi:GNAT superfamily N-acetyltransferase